MWDRMTVQQTIQLQKHLWDISNAPDFMRGQESVLYLPKLTKWVNWDQVKLPLQLSKANLCRGSVKLDQSWAQTNLLKCHRFWLWDTFVRFVTIQHTGHVHARYYWGTSVWDTCLTKALGQREFIHMKMSRNYGHSIAFGGVFFPL